MKLTNPTDDQLNAAFAEHVAGWRRHRTERPFWMTLDDDKVLLCFTTSADAVLPWLEKWHWRGTSNGMSGSTNGYPHYSIIIWGIGPEEYTADWFSGDLLAESFARCAVIALLRAHGVDVEFTKGTQ